MRSIVSGANCIWGKECEMGLEQWGASEQYYKIASVHPEYELGRVISQELRKRSLKKLRSITKTI